MRTGYDMNGVVFETGGEALLTRVGPLWEKLRDHHATCSAHFSGLLAKRSFADRTSDILHHAHKVRVDLAVHGGHDIAYCISTLSSMAHGEVDSLYVEADYRGQSLGEALVRRGLAWLDENNATRMSLSVVYGNEAVLSFYRRLGFYPRNIELDQLPSLENSKV